MARLIHYVKQKGLVCDVAGVDEYKHSLTHVIETIRKYYIGNDQEIISAESAINKIKEADVIVLVGTTWLAVFDIIDPWFLSDKYCSEEFFGERPGKKLDLQDFVDGSTALARAYGCRYMEFGTRSNPKQLAMARLCERTGMRVANIILQKEIPNG